MDLRRTHPDVHITVVMPGMVTTAFAANAIAGAPLPPEVAARGQAQTPEQVAAAIVEVIEHPRAEIATNPSQTGVVERYYHDVAAFEAGMG
jgi:short-subunit dehydrogenase